MLILGEIILGFILLFIGGEAIVYSAVKISKRFNIPTSLIGLTIVAYGTSSPELFITTVASINDHPQIAFGNIIGSNITNILLILGICAFIKPISVPRKAINFDLKYMFIATVALIIFSSLGLISRFEGFVLVFMLITYSYVTYKLSYNAPELTESSDSEHAFPFKIKLSIVTSFALFFVSIALLVLGSKLLILGAVELATIFNIPQSVIAVTIIAIGGSAPELSTSIVASIRNHADLAISNVVGSNIFNILGVLGITSIIKPISTLSTTLSQFDIWVMLVTTMLFYFICYVYKRISRTSGALFLFMYALYIIWEISLIL